jgi:hypothetical protein
MTNENVMLSAINFKLCERCLLSFSNADSNEICDVSHYFHYFHYFNCDLYVTCMYLVYRSNTTKIS